MRPKTLLGLFAVVAGLAAFLWFVERDLPGTDERAARAKRLLALEGDVSRLTIERAGERLVFQRSVADEWRLGEPVDGRADGSLVDGLVTALGELDKERTFDDAEPAELGLDPPRARVTLTAEDGDRTVLVGSEVPASDSMIVAAGAAGPFHVVSGAFWPDIERPLEDWRVRSVFPGRRDEIAGVTLVDGDRSVSLVSRDGGYYLEAPLEDRADEGTMSRFLDALVDLEAIAFVDDPAAEGDLGLDDSTRRLEIVLRDADTPWRLELGRPAPVPDEPSEAEEAEAGDASDAVPPRYVRADGQTYVVPDRLTAALERPAAEWRSLDWTGLQVHEIERLTVEDAAGILTLEREGGDWLRDGVETEYGPVSDLLYDLVGTKAEALDAGAAVAGPPLLGLTLDAGAEELALEVFAPRGDRYPATASDRSTALWLGGDRVRSLMARIAEVRAAEAVVDELEETPSEPGEEASAGSR